MNKTLIALAVSAVTLATGAYAQDGKQAGDQPGTSVYSANGNSLEIGGRAEARMSVKDGEVADKTRVRLNLLGKTQITDTLYGLGFYEGEYTADEKGGATDKGEYDITHRNLYAGIGGTFGEISYGKTNGALGYITDFTDIMAYHGNSAADKLAVADRSDNMIAYHGKLVDDALTLKASYRFADQDVDSNDNFTNNDRDGYSIALAYELSKIGLELGAGYADQGESDEFMVGGNYKIGNAYIAALYTDGQKDNFNGANTTYVADYTGYEAAFGYTLDKTVFTATYNNAETNNETSANNIAIDATYYFKPNFRAYVSYNFNLIDQGDVLGAVQAGNDIASNTDAEDELALGLRYDF